jgi:HSP20 family protein
MKITRSTPAPMLKPEVARFFDRVFGPFDLPEMKVFESAWVPTVDLTESDKEFVVRLEAPGIHRENLDVNLDGNILTLSGRRETFKESEEEEFLFREREQGKFMRSIRLPVAVDQAKILASYQDGVLVVHLPKAEPTMKTRILIK